ncbi:MAG: alpha-glucosidase [Candidatus Heimdallarchaeota archaeon]|nr:alpha-glucosidase [Candidatus Heimdallarchaeota archaeon]
MLEINHMATGFNILYNNFEIIRHTREKPFCVVGVGKGIYSMSHGMFKIKEKLQNRYLLIDYTIIEESIKNITLEFTIFDGSKFQIIIKETKGNIEILFVTDNSSLNRLWINFPALIDEAIYGCGEQYSEVNLRGKKVPLWCQEQGVGRGDPKFFTLLADVFKNAGGDAFTTYFPQPTFVSSRNYFCHVETTCYSEFNFKNNLFHELYIWEIPAKIILGKYKTALQTIGNLSILLGKQQSLPEWIYDGIILGIQGGSEVVDKKLATCKEFDIPIAGVWCQDWEGNRITSFGKQLFWDWFFDSTLYPNLPTYIEQLHKEGIKFLGYINPFLALEGKLYQEASKKGFLVQRPKGKGEYHIEITTFPAAILDLTNPDATMWIKKIIKQNLLGIGMDGWMADFGEYLPVNAVLHSDEDPEKYHNKYPVEWAKINKEALEETKKLNEVVFFTRAGYTNTSKYSPLVWAGDQLVNWSVHDGLASVIPAGISLGICGIANYHFDIGGYTTIGPFKRTKEVFMRWVEAAAFTMVMRTHEGNRPEDNWQFDSDEETLKHLAKMVKLHVKLKPYLKKLAKDYIENGYPPIRASYMHYENDKILHQLKYQYLLGSDILVAPVIQESQITQRVYLPDDDWVHIWSNQEYDGLDWVTVNAPIGEPPVFYRKNSQNEKLLSELSD